jgi:hypothetical protein
VISQVSEKPCDRAFRIGPAWRSMEGSGTRRDRSGTYAARLSVRSLHAANIEMTCSCVAVPVGLLDFSRRQSRRDSCMQGRKAPDGV